MNVHLPKTSPSASVGHIIAATCVVFAASISVVASSTYMYSAMATDLDLDSSEANLLKYVPSLATVLVVFVAGVLGDRIGHRRTIILGSLTYIIGSVFCAAAPNGFTEIVAMSVVAAGASSMTVVAVAMMSRAVTGDADRARAFGTLGVMSPLVYLAAPLITGALVTYVSWRVVYVLFVVIGLLGLIMVRALIPADPPDGEAGELVTPLLAGVALVLATQFLSKFGTDGLLAPSTLILLGVTVGVGALLFVIRGRIANPSLSIGPLTRRRSILLLVACIAIPLASMWYTTYLIFEFLFELTPLQIAVIMIPAQILGMIAAKTGSVLIIRLGMLRAGIVAFIVATLSQLSFFAVSEDQLVLAIVLTSIFSFTSGLLLVIMSNSVMDAAPKSESGAMSSYRSASSRIGGAIASLLISTVVFTSYYSSLTTQSEAAGIPVSATDQISQAFIQNDEGTGQNPPTNAATQQVSEIQQQAMLDALYTKGAYGAVVMLIAGSLFIIAMRRRRDEKESVAEVAQA